MEPLNLQWEVMMVLTCELIGIHLVHEIKQRGRCFHNPEQL